jgi:TonB family protein
MKEEIKKLDKKFINDKNVIEFMMNENGTIDSIKFLRKSDERNLDKMTMKIVEQASKQMITPKEKTPMRFIFIYRIGQSAINNQSNDSSAANVSTYEIPIPKGTTRFEHTSKEYVRVFETSKDGFVNLSTTPNQCMKRITLLDSDGRKIGVSYAEMLGINVEILKGSYKLLFQTKKTCDVSLQYQ